MLGHTKGKRSAVTCALKCDNACAGDVCNTSSNSYFRDIASATMSRRAALGFGAAGALAVVLGSAVTSAQPATAAGLSPAAKEGFGTSKLKFTAIPSIAADVDAVTVPEGFTWQPVIRWATRSSTTPRPSTWTTRPPQPRKSSSATTTTTRTSLRFPGSNGRRALLFANHEYTNENIMFPAASPRPTCAPWARPHTG